MNLIHRSIWNDQTGTFVAVSEITRSAGKKISSCTAAAGTGSSFSLKILAVSLMMACGAGVHAQPVGGVVSAGSATIGGAPGNMTITQTTPNVAINWQSFGVRAGESVQFVQPGSSSVALNRVIGSDPSNILGSLTANGKVFLVNPNGILFGAGASVNVGGLVASTLAISDADFMANNYKFSGAGAGSVLNQGTINARLVRLSRWTWRATSCSTSR
ncbi:filamentous hemagglutinin N-terminal domain-containing protein [Acidovorax sp. 16-64-162]|uniref:two-partner secretion domain-containing protein n=1 Tax=Acidovorax sp. 16-64-162 TaxID=1970307 RepID=UPI0025BFC104|nr:filamentous hemagglutinin N-terminal domain-containing protein [Acidovorax sp. 16-64-162]